MRLVIRSQIMFQLLIAVQQKINKEIVNLCFFLKEIETNLEYLYKQVLLQIKALNLSTPEFSVFSSFSFLTQTQIIIRLKGDWSSHQIQEIENNFEQNIHHNNLKPNLYIYQMKIELRQQKQQMQRFSMRARRNINSFMMKQSKINKNGNSKIQRQVQRFFKSE